VRACCVCRLYRILISAFVENSFYALFRLPYMQCTKLSWKTDAALVLLSDSVAIYSHVSPMEQIK
jgi:hypothetical protein